MAKEENIADIEEIEDEEEYSEEPKSKSENPTLSKHEVIDMIEGNIARAVQLLQLLR